MSSSDPLTLTELPTRSDLEPVDGEPTRKLPVAAPAGQTPMVLGMKYDLLIRFLKLFRDHYRKCEKATSFLEHRTDVPNLASIANKRDAISHFASALQEGSSREKQEDQFSKAEEHLRRSIIEPYETALSKTIDRLEPVYEAYRRDVLPVRDRHDDLKSFPDSEALDATMRTITKLRDSARAAKGRNIWDEVWEQGVDDYAEGFDLADALLAKLQEGIWRLRQIEKDEANRGEIARLQARLEERDKRIAELENGEGG